MAATARAQTAPPAAADLPASVLEALTVAAGYVAPVAGLEDDGVIVASATEGDIEERSLSVFDVIYVEKTFDGRKAVVGDSLLLYRDGGEVDHPATEADLGHIVYPTGVAVVTGEEGEVVTAVITRGFDPVVAGQRVQYLVKRESPLPAGERSGGEGRVVAVRDPAAILEPYAVVYLDLRPAGDLRAGDEVEFFRRDYEEGRRLPDVLIGSARVVDVGSAAATALVTWLARSDLRVGDRYRPMP